MVVVNPGLGMMRVLFVIVGCGGSSLQKDVLAVEPEVVSEQRLIAPEHHLAPEVRMLS